MMTDISKQNPADQVSFLGAVAIGIGGMVGGGIFAVLGLAAVLAGGATPVAFAIAGLVALLTAYSYAKLSVAYQDNGGTVIFIDKAFGRGWLTGALNNLLWLGYVITVALYAVAFGNYASTFLPEHLQNAASNHLLICSGILIPLLLNFFGATVVSKAETYVVALKIAILLLVVGAGIGGIDASHLSPSTWASPLQVAGAGMIIFVAYEGFELIANTAATVKNPEITLPRAYYSSVAFVIVLYILISTVVIGALTTDQILSSQDFALAKAAEPSLGHFGFIIVGVAAVLATLSAINSTLYGAARLSYSIAVEGELPAEFELKVWQQPVGLLMTGGGALLLSNLVDISSISMMASASFLMIFAMVNLACFVKFTHAKSNRMIAILGVISCTLALFSLLLHTFETSPADLWFLAGLAALTLTGEGVFQFFWKTNRRNL